MSPFHRLLQPPAKKGSDLLKSGLKKINDIGPLIGKKSVNSCRQRVFFIPGATPLYIASFDGDVLT
jgi:hypothetical protein